MSFVIQSPEQFRSRLRKKSETGAECLATRIRKTEVVNIFRMLIVAMPLMMPAGVLAQEESVTARLLQESVDRLREESHLVAVGTTLLVDGKIVAAAVSGTRRQSSDVAVTVNDQWHIGSITKSMTATVIGKLVERGQLSWDSPLPDLLPGMAKNFDESWGHVTLHNVLTHTAGLPANFSLLERLDWPDNPDAVHERRKEALSEILAQPTESPPGTAFVYSNVGYTLAGLIAECARIDWDASPFHQMGWQDRTQWIDE